MKTFAILILSVCSILFAGCASTPNQQAAVDLAIGVGTDAASIVIRRNPAAVVTLRAISLGIDSVLSTGVLSQAQVDAFVAGLDRNNHLTADDRFIIGRAVRRIHQALVVYGGCPDLNIGDPKIRAALERVKAAINEVTAS